MNAPLPNDLVARLKLLAKRECWIDDPSGTVLDYCGGNYDDAYSGGYDDGQAKLACEVLTALENRNGQ